MYISDIHFNRGKLLYQTIDEQVRPVSRVSIEGGEFCENLVENWQGYNGTALYLTRNHLPQVWLIGRMGSLPGAYLKPKTNILEIFEWA